MQKAILFGFLVLYTACAVKLSASKGRSYIDRTAPLEIPHGWNFAEHSSGDEEVKLVLALKQRNVDKMFARFEEITSPTHANYGKYWTPEEMHDMMAPTHQVQNTVLDWLQVHGVHLKNMEFHKSRDFITIRVPSSVASNLLGTKFHHWNHQETGVRLLRSLGPYSAPDHVSPHLDFVIGHLGLPKNMNAYNRKRNVDIEEHDNAKRMAVPVTPQVIRQRYNISNSFIGGNPANKQGVVEFMTNYYSPSDLHSFFDHFWIGRGYNASVKRVIGQNINEMATDQTNLDVQYLMGVAPNVPTWVWLNTGADFWSDLSGWVSQIFNFEGKVPLTNVISYGNEGEGPSQEFRDRISIEFARIGGLGITIIVATGDSGTDCSLCYYFEPSFPASSPYVTAVGSTQFSEDKISTEIGTKSFASGGGFSWNFVRPKYQNDVVSHYFFSQKIMPAEHFFNPYGRGIPDISALGSDFQIITNGRAKVYQGTAAAAVTVTAMISLLNEIRLSKNLPPMGFINNWLYEVNEKHPIAFFDVLEGNNHHGCCGYTGFVSSEGWDPVTGLGTPNFDILSKLVANKVPL